VIIRLLASVLAGSLDMVRMCLALLRVGFDTLEKGHDPDLNQALLGIWADARQFQWPPFSLREVTNSLFHTSL